MGSERETVARRQREMKNAWLLSSLGLLVTTLSLVCLLTSQVRFFAFSQRVYFEWSVQRSKTRS